MPLPVRILALQSCMCSMSQLAPGVKSSFCLHFWFMLCHLTLQIKVTNLVQVKLSDSISINYLLHQLEQIMRTVEPLSQMAVYKSSGKAPNKSYYKMICKRIWDFGMLGGMEAGYLLLFWSAPIHSDPFFLDIQCQTHTRKNLYSASASSFILAFPNFFNLAGK